VIVYLSKGLRHTQTIDSQFSGSQPDNLEGKYLRKILKIAPIALLAVLSFAHLVNAAPLAPMPAAHCDWLQRSIPTRTMGPPLVWDKTYGNDSTDTFYDIVQCSDGYAMTGRTYSWGEGLSDVYLVKIENDGTLLFNKTFGYTGYDYGRAIVALNDGFAIAGYTDHFGTNDVWLIKTDLNGNHLWNRTFDTCANDYGYGLVVSADGNFTIVGYSYFTTQYDTWLIHTNSTGHLVWEDHYGIVDDDDIGYDLVECTGGGYAVTGYTNNNYGVIGSAVWLLRVDSNGGYLWNQTYDGPGYENGNSIVECSSGGFAIAGHTDSYNTDDDFWLIKTDASGSHQWNATYDSGDDDQAEGLIEYSDGGFALAGWCVTPTTLQRVASSRGFNPMDGLLVRTDASGSQLWNKTHGDGGSDHDWYYSLVEGSGGELLCAGYTDRSSGAGSNDGWVTKTRYPIIWNPAPTDQVVPYGLPLAYDLNVTSRFAIDSWTINDTGFAISTTGVVSLALALPSGVYALQVSVTDTIGSEISGEFTVTIEAPLFSPIPFLIGGVIVVIIVVILLLLYYFVLRNRK
jgi:hypothetical protein